MFRDLMDLLKVNCLSQNSECVRDFRMSSDGKKSGFSLMVGFLAP